MKSHVAVLFLLLFSARAFGFGREGHEAIAEIARENLNPEAKASIGKILGSDDLPSIATWLDDVRAAGRNRGEMRGDAEALDFVRRFPGSPKWHFVNVPVGAPGYEADGPYASRNDVAHAIALAVGTLEGHETGLTQLEALRVVVHTVGDIMQPLHCVAGYYDLSDPSAPRLLAPSEVTAVSPSDAGGNALFFTKSEQLHEYFDSVLLKKIAGADYQQLAAAVVREYGPYHRTTVGDYHHWPVVWATESVHLGTEAYADLQFVAADITGGPGHPALRLHRIEIRLPSGYAEREMPVMARQVSEAGLRLADLLNSIHWSGN